ncbi:2-hydroxyacid dehydrogenase (plasmid) [Microvirga sp. RSM25]|uniref:2-hydroxyacid dehydrogenase n=1 Tax=Microvirga sp. RSM25 TaxID=3273802 RepID=UPI00384B46F2
MWEDGKLIRRILVTSRLPDDCRSFVPAGVELIEGNDLSVPMTRAEVLSRLADVDALINQNELTIDEELLGAAPRLKIVANATAGFNNMDVRAMERRSVWGTNCPNSFASATADHTLCLLLAVSRRLIEADRYVRSGKWESDGWTPGRWDGISLEGRTLGIVGYGRIGRQVAQRAAAFQMTIRHCDEYARDENFVPFEELLAIADVLTLHCPLTDETHHLLNSRTLKLMKRGAILLNVSRGPVIENQALVEALRSGHLGGAGLDVFEFEPAVPEALLTMQNVVLSPHIGGGTVESKRSAWAQCFSNIGQLMSGEKPATPVTSI